MKKVVTMGGGGGHAAIIKALKGLEVELSAVVNVVDDGGHSGRLMRELGVHSPGDARRVLSAASEQAEKFLEHRSPDGSAYGNLLLAAAEKETGSFQKAIDNLRQQMQITFKVFPVSEDKIILHGETADHKTITGQQEMVKHIRSHGDQPYEKIWIEPKNAKISAGAESVLETADYLVVAMGDLYSSVGAVMCLPDLFKHLKKEAKIVWLPNFAVTPGHVHYQTTSGALKFLQSVNSDFRPDIIIAHDGSFSDNLKTGLRIMDYTTSQLDANELGNALIISTDLVNSNYVPHNEQGDLIDRSPISYDIDKLKNVFKKIIV